MGSSQIFPEIAKELGNNLFLTGVIYIDFDKSRSNRKGVPMHSSKLYLPGETVPFRLSRSKIEEFVRCPRCFVLGVKHGIKKPNSVPFTLNLAVDNQMKKEFDIYRAKQEVHPIVAAAGLDLAPFQHPALDVWRNNFKGIEVETEDERFVIAGAVDDIWVDGKGVLYVVDYKATGRQQAVTELGDGGFYDGYRRQMEIYQWILRKKGFEVSNTGYWVYVTATQKQESFENALLFESNLVAYEGDASWIQQTLNSIYANLNEPEVAGPGEDCDVCLFFDQRANLAIKWHELVWQNCDNCGSRMLKTIFGMVTGEPAAGHVSMGCIVGEDDPEWICPKCDLEEDDDEEY